MSTSQSFNFFIPNDNENYQKSELHHRELQTVVGELDKNEFNDRQKFHILISSVVKTIKNWNLSEQSSQMSMKVIKSSKNWSNVSNFHGHICSHHYLIYVQLFNLKSLNFCYRFYFMNTIPHYLSRENRWRGERMYHKLINIIVMSWIVDKNLCEIRENPQHS